MKFSVFVVEGRGEITGDWCRVSGLIVSKESWHTVWQSSLRRRRADHVGRLSRPTAARPLGGTVLHRWSRLCRRHSSRARHWLLVATQHAHTHSDYFQLVLITLIVHRLCRWLGKTIAVIICIHSVGSTNWNSYTKPDAFHVSHPATSDHWSNKKHLKNVGPIRHCEPFYPFTRCRYTPPAHRCLQQRQQRLRVTEGTAMAPWNGPNEMKCMIFSSELVYIYAICHNNYLSTVVLVWPVSSLL